VRLERHQRCQLDLVSADRQDVVWVQVSRDQRQVSVDQVLQGSAHQAFLPRASHQEDHQASQGEEADHVSLMLSMWLDLPTDRMQLAFHLRVSEDHQAAHLVSDSTDPLLSDDD